MSAPKFITPADLRRLLSIALLATVAGFFCAVFSQFASFAATGEWMMEWSRFLSAMAATVVYGAAVAFAREMLSDED